VWGQGENRTISALLASRFISILRSKFQIMTKIKKIIYFHPVSLLLLLLLQALLLNGCAVVAPVEERTPSSPAAALLAEAEESLQAEDYSRAELQVERALRVEPRNGRAWHLMAQIRYGQGDYGQTVQFCLKSNTLADNDRNLSRQNWKLLEKAYTGMGETSKAEEARQKAAAL
jgi:tetratricopeptide (TPR) repeat protein